MKKPATALSTLLLLAALPLGALAAGTEKPVTGSSSTTGASAGEYIDDAAITAKVKAAFVKDESVKATQINVETSKGLVQLSGFADNRASIDRAVEVARRVPGVKEVKNDIRLK